MGGGSGGCSGWNLEVASDESNVVGRKGGQLVLHVGNLDGRNVQILAVDRTDRSGLFGDEGACGGVYGHIHLVKITGKAGSREPVGSID